MNDYYSLAWLLAFQTPLVCLVICVYVFFALRTNGLTRRETVCLRIMAISCVGEMIHEVLAGFLFYGILESSYVPLIYLYTIAYSFMALAAASFCEFCIFRLKSPSRLLCGIIRGLYALTALFLIARVCLSRTKLFTFVNPDSSVGFGILDDAQTWCCFAMLLIVFVTILVCFFDRNEYVEREKYGKLLTASVVILFVFAVYILTYVPFIISIGYMLVLLFTVISNQGLLIDTDELTRLSNRRRFLKDADVCTAEKKPWSYILSDINGFKQVNDSFGHNEGDEALKRFSGVWKAVALKNGATAYRMGGDEFAVLIPTDREETVLTVCREIEDALKQYNEENDLPYVLSASIGFAVSGKDGLTDIPDIMEEADKRMYEQKRLVRTR